VVVTLSIHNNDQTNVDFLVLFHFQALPMNPTLKHKQFSQFQQTNYFHNEDSWFF